MEARHKREVEEWEIANPDLDAEKDTTVLSTTSGLYDLKIGADEEKDVKVGLIRLASSASLGPQIIHHILRMMLHMQNGSASDLK